MTSAPRGTAQRSRQLGGLLLIAGVMLYAPLSFTFFLNGPTEVRLQDRVLEFLVSPRFAFGLGSENDGHTQTYVATYASMLTHSIVGTIALVTGALQFYGRLRARVPRFHRVLGRVYVASSLTVASLGIAYLVRTPVADVFAGAGFAGSLWLAATGTLTSTVLAFLAILRRDFAAHRELMALSYALIWTAPLLRIEWVVLAQFWHTTKQMLTLSVGVTEGAILFTGATVYVSRYRSRARTPARPVTNRDLQLAWAASAVAALAAVPLVRATDWSDAPAWFDPGWTPLIVSVGGVWVAQTAFFVHRARSARLRGNMADHAAWRFYLLGNAVGPVAGLAAFGITSVLMGAEFPTAWYGAALGWNLTLFLAYVVHTLSTTRFLKTGPGADGVALDASGDMATERG